MIIPPETTFKIITVLRKAGAMEIADILSKEGFTGLTKALIENPKGIYTTLKGLPDDVFNQLFKEAGRTPAGNLFRKEFYRLIKESSFDSTKKGFPLWIKVVASAAVMAMMFAAFQWSDFVFGLRKSKILPPYQSDLLNDATYKSSAVVKALSNIKFNCNTDAYKLAKKDVEAVNKLWNDAISYAEKNRYKSQFAGLATIFKAYMGLGSYPTTGAMAEALTTGKELFNNQTKIEIAVIESNCPEFVEIKLPEQISVFVRDIIDGDTIDVSLEGENILTGEVVKLSEYKDTKHCRVRLVGINTPEKSPKGEITCTGYDIQKVEPKRATLARENLLELNDKTVVLKIDPDNILETHGRLLGIVEYLKEDIALKQIRQGMACYYFRSIHRWVDDNLYKKENKKAHDEKIGMWAEVLLPKKEEKETEIETEEIEKFTIFIDSTPTEAKLFIDDVYTHHYTPSDEKELQDVMDLLSPGKHTFKATKAGLIAEKEINIVAGKNEDIILKLEEPTLTNNNNLLFFNEQ